MDLKTDTLLSTMWDLYFFLRFDSKDRITPAEFEKLIKIPSLCIKDYADLKLSDEEKQYCYSYVSNCTKDNSFIIDKQVNSIENFFLKSYTKYLLVNDPKSDYISSDNDVISKKPLLSII